MPVVITPAPVPALTLCVANTLYLTEDGLSWLALEDGTDLLTDALTSLYQTEDALSWLLAEDGTDLSTEMDLGLCTDLTAYLRYGSVTLILNTIDFTLMDPPVGSTPQGATVTTTNPAWSGTISAATSLDPVDRQGHVWYTVTATNTNALPNDTAPFDLSETVVDSTFRYLLEDGSGYYLQEPGTDFAPGNLRLEGSLAYGYSALSVRNSVVAGAPDATLGRCVVQQPGLRPGNTFHLTSTNQGYANFPFQINQATIKWQGQTVPVYTIEFGAVPQTLATYVQATAPLATPMVAPQVTVPAGPATYGRVTIGHKLWPMGGGIVSIASSTFTVSLPSGHTLTCQVQGAIDCRAFAWDNYVGTPRRAVRATLSGGIYTGAWQETPLGTATTAGARATYDLSSSLGLAMAAGTYTVTIDIDTQEFNQLEVFSGWVQVVVTVV